MRKAAKKIFKERAIHDVRDLRLAILNLNVSGFAFETKLCLSDAHKLYLSDTKTGHRFIIEDIGHNDWPGEISV